jgi:hypothetical protein
VPDIDWNERITPHFTRRELGSPDTGEVRFEYRFLDSLEALRRDLDQPMVVTSGCRSPEHNQRLVQDPRYQAHPHSLHKFENEKWGIDAIAVDVACTESGYRRHLIKLALLRNFSVGVGRTFLHLDLRTFYIDLPSVVFVYDTSTDR